MKKIFFQLASIAVIFLSMLFTSCSNDDNNDEPQPAIGSTHYDEILEGEIIGEKTLDANKVYLLRGFVYVYTPDVNNPSVLTIPAGTVIKGEKATKGALIIEPGSKIIAKGTVDKPIVFTSDQPAGQRNYGDWGGLILCGNARVNSNRPQIEGGPRTIYGGTNDEDNSGTLQYVRIEFP